MQQPAPASPPASRAPKPAGTAGDATGTARAGWWQVQPWLSTVVRLALGAVFTVAGLAKIGNVPETVRAVRAYRILPESLVHPLAYALPYLELAVAALLILGLGTRIVAVVAGIMLLLFIAAVASLGPRGIRIDCGCFGGGGIVKQTHYLREIARDSGFFLLAAWLALLPASRLSLDSFLDL